MKRTRFPVLLTFDRNFLIPAKVTIHSLIKHNSQIDFAFYVICLSSEREFLVPIKTWVKDLGFEIKFVEVDPLKVEKIKVNLHFSIANYLRLFSADLIQEDKLLYLDTDVIVTQNVSELIGLELGEIPLAAVADPNVRDIDRLELTRKQGYFNSGVMLLNLKKWKEIDLGSRSLDFIFSYPEKINFADQCGLNAVLKGNWMRLDPKWNLQTSFFKDQNTELFLEYFDAEEFEKALSSPGIIHYTEAPKPWQLQSKHPLKKLYWDNLEEIGFAAQMKSSHGLMDYLKLGVPKSIKKRYWRYLGKTKTEE